MTYYRHKLIEKKAQRTIQLNTITYNYDLL